MCSHNFSGTVTFEHLISVTELKYKLAFIIYHVDDMMRYLRNLSRPYPLSHTYPSIPTFGIRARAALSCVAGKNAGGYGCNWGVQCRPPCTVYIACALILFEFLPVISTVMVTCTYLFNVDNNHLQKSTILSSGIYRYTVLSSHYINLSLTNCVRKFDHEIILNFCVLRLLYYTSAHNTFCIIWRAA